MMPDVLIAVVQAFFTVLAGALLFVLWRRFAREQIGVRIVAFGFVVRAALSCVVFWISWLELPIGRPLQLGDGFWFYGLDGKGYHELAAHLLSSGTLGPLVPDRSMPASTWVQVLSFGRWTMGSSAAAAGLINAACFLGGALIIAAWGRSSGAVAEARLAVVAITFSPALNLWATQPLKDTFFVFLLIAFLCAHARWQQLAGDAGGTRWRITALGMTLTAYFLAGVRWYYAVILWSAFALASLWSVVSNRNGRKRRLARGILVFVGVGLALAMTTPWSVIEGVKALVGIPTWAVNVLQSSKTGFETGYDASTVVSAGEAIDGIPQSMLLARMLMAVLPRVLLQPLGLVEAGGGRGLWAFADLDTLFFLGVIVFAGRAIRGNRPAWIVRRPAALLIVLALLASLAMFYVVNNFGTLLRLRLLLMVPLALLPLTIVSSAPEDGTSVSDSRRKNNETDSEEDRR